MSVSNLSWLKKKSQSVDITAPGLNPLAGAGKQMPQASKPPAPKTPIIEEEENNSANTQKHPSRRSELKRFYTIAQPSGPNAGPPPTSLAVLKVWSSQTVGAGGAGQAAPWEPSGRGGGADGALRLAEKSPASQRMQLFSEERTSFRSSVLPVWVFGSKKKSFSKLLSSFCSPGARFPDGSPRGHARDAFSPSQPPVRRWEPPPPCRVRWLPETLGLPGPCPGGMDYLITITGKSGRLLRGTANRLWGFGGGGEARQVCFEDYLREPAPGDPGCGSPPPRPPAPSNPEGHDTGQKKTLDKKDGRRMSFQKPKGTIEYTVESRDSLNSISLKFDTTPNELVQLNKLFSRAVVTGQVLYVPDPEYVSSVESSPSLSPISPLSPTSSEAEFDKTTNPDVVHLKETTPSSTFTGIRPARVVSSTSEEEEAFTEKFLKINCKYITRGKGTVSGVLLVTPNNIMFDPHKTDPLVQENGCEEYGIMCPMEEVMSAAMYKEILDSKIKESLPIEISDQLSGRDFCHLKKMTRSNTDEIDSRTREAGNDSASTAPRSTEESLSEDVFTESELSPTREELVSSDELRQGKSSGASSESVQTVHRSGVQCLTVMSESSATPDQLKSDSGHSASEVGALSLKTDLNNTEMAAKEGDQPTDNTQEIPGPKEECINIKGNADQDFLSENSLHQEEDEKESIPCGKATEFKQKQTVKGKQGKEQNQDSETEVEELRKLWKTHTMQQTKQQRENIQQVSQKEIKHKVATADIEGSALLKEKRRHRLHKFLCLRVGKPMRKTFVSQASATMQQYAQRDKKHEYWFAVPQERTDHLYAFFIQWSPEIYAEDTGEYTREPGFIVVKKIEESETNEDSTNEAAAREWEVVSVAEYHRRIDALNTEELRTLCRRLQITTREDISSKQVAPVKADLESESFRPNLSDPSELLLPDQIEKLTKHLPPRTIGYPWTLAYGTGKHGTSLKTLYRTMTGLDTPVLMVIKDSDGQVFGALASEPFKVSDGFYGTGETFVFTFCPEFEVFKWTGDNMFFIKGDMDSLAFGGGGGEFALWLDGDLYHGRSHSCKTFGNRTLSKKEDFFIQDIEIWAFE